MLGLFYHIQLQMQLYLKNKRIYEIIDMFVFGLFCL